MAHYQYGHFSRTPQRHVEAPMYKVNLHRDLNILNFKKKRIQTVPMVGLGIRSHTLQTSTEHLAGPGKGKTKDMISMDQILHLTNIALGKSRDTRINMAINLMHIMVKSKVARNTMKSHILAIQEAHRTRVPMWQIPIAHMGDLVADQTLGISGVKEVDEPKMGDELNMGNEDTLVEEDRVEDPVPACEEHQSHTAEDVEGIIIMQHVCKNLTKD
ncbi:hypothetical protein LTS15_009444 [Exophiala xenobiotica]|nr:hypothetical protein LTS15_009444 [Exophiala xenobiotica]